MSKPQEKPWKVKRERVYARGRRVWRWALYFRGDLYAHYPTRKQAETAGPNRPANGYGRVYDTSQPVPRCERYL